MGKLKEKLDVIEVDYFGGMRDFLKIPLKFQSINRVP
jgi:hypothetical protein